MIKILILELNKFEFIEMNGGALSRKKYFSNHGREIRIQDVLIWE